MVLYALHRLYFPLKVEIVTNIIHFTDDLCIFHVLLILVYLNTHLTNRKNKVCFSISNTLFYMSY